MSNITHQLSKDEYNTIYFALEDMIRTMETKLPNYFSEKAEYYIKLRRKIDLLRKMEIDQ